MEVSVKGKNTEVTQPLRDYATKKISRLSKYFSEIKEARVVYTHQRNTHVIEVLLEGDGILLRGEDGADAAFAAIDLVVEKLEQRVKRYKGKLYGRTHERGPKEKQALRDKAAQEADAPVPDSEDDDGFVPKISRTKRFHAKPMAPDEAVTQMELLHHDFFVFINSETSQVSVVYKREEGDYGLLEPDF